MKNFKKITLSLFAAAALFSSCSKEDETSIVEEPVVVVPTADDFIVNTWVMTSAKAIQKGTEIDIFVDFEDCDKDDEYTFNADKSYSFGAGDTKCSDTDPDVYSAGTYIFIDSYSKIVTTETGATSGDTIGVKSITATEVILQDIDIDMDTGDTTYFEYGLTPKM